ncbi:MAG: hypothetical protein LVQ95_01895 [Candidatus Micrarchaeales archaeon]|nr:hypothetical protein [Candidatus Micrarchaeales archaeon]
MHEVRGGNTYKMTTEVQDALSVFLRKQQEQEQVERPQITNPNQLLIFRVRRIRKGWRHGDGKL